MRLSRNSPISHNDNSMMTDGVRRPSSRVSQVNWASRRASKSLINPGLSNALRLPVAEFACRRQKAHPPGLVQASMTSRRSPERLEKLRGRSNEHDFLENMAKEIAFRSPLRVKKMPVRALLPASRPFTVGSQVIPVGGSGFAGQSANGMFLSHEVYGELRGNGPRSNHACTTLFTLLSAAAQEQTFPGFLKLHREFVDRSNKLDVKTDKGREIYLVTESLRAFLEGHLLRMACHFYQDVYGHNKVADFRGDAILAGGFDYLAKFDERPAEVRKRYEDPLLLLKEIRAVAPKDAAVER